MNGLVSKSIIGALRSTTRRANPAGMVKHFSNTKMSLEASLLHMPAMSPTMTEGGIVEWKFKEGDSFSAGDVLLQIETDKAQIDVEAQDDGILAKIYADNGQQNVAVGYGIAAIAEPSDDIKSIELPKPDSEGGSASSSSQKSEPEQNQEEQKAESSTKTSPPASNETSSSGTAANPSQTLLPSVLNLLHRNNLSEEDAISRVPATGPNGRLLKGDVLAYLGIVSKDSVSIVSENIKSLQHLDLSNIKKAAAPTSETKPQEQQTQQEPTKEAEKTQVSAPAAPSKPVQPEPVVFKNSFSLSDLSLLRTTVDATLETDISVRSLVDKASKLAHRDVTVLSKPKKSVLNDPMFDALVAPPKSGKPAFQEKFSYTSIGPIVEGGSKRSPDALDILTSDRKPVSSPKRANQSGHQHLDVSVKVNGTSAESEKRAKLYLNRLEYYLTDGKGDLLL